MVKEALIKAWFPIFSYLLAENAPAEAEHGGRRLGFAGRFPFDRGDWVLVFTSARGLPRVFFTT